MLAIWDRAAALERVAGDKTLLIELISIFFEDYPKYHAALVQSLEQEDFAALRQAAHTIKGSLSYLGGRDGASLALRIEQAGLETNLARARELVPQLMAYLDSIKPMMLSLAEESDDAGDR